MAGLDAEMRLLPDTALALLRQARAADPAFLPAQLEYIDIRWQRSDFVRVRREFARPDPAGGIVTECLAFATAARTTGSQPPHAAPYARLKAIQDRDSSGCAVTYLALMSSWEQPFDGRSDADALAQAQRAWREAPGIAANWLVLSTFLARSDLPAAVRIDEEALTRVWPDKTSGDLYLRAIDHLVLLHDTTEARRLAVPFAAAEMRDGRPLATIYGCAALRTAGLDTPAICSAAPRAPAADDWSFRLNVIEGRGSGLVDAGDARRAVVTLDSAVTLTDGAGWPGPRLRAHVRRGRAEIKTGDVARALRDLKMAIALDDEVDDSYWSAEAWHNLAHAYEAAGNWPAAVAAVDSFASLTSTARWSDQRLVSRYDAGVIRWEAGWHVAADSQFAVMVRIVNDQDRGQYWAGAFYERIGDLGRARRYYLESVRTGVGSGLWYTQALAGLVRIYDALGFADSARAVAAAHDSAQHDWVPVDAPLLPSLAARHGRFAEGVMLTNRWADRQLAAGNIQGAAYAEDATAELALDARDGTHALQSATRAESLAAGIHLVDAQIRAVTLKGRALAVLGRRTDAIDQLRRATKMALEHPGVAQLLSASLALGDALDGSGARRGALSAYDRAARAAERVTEGLPDDFDRSRYRALHLAPFDRAMLMLLRSGPREPVDEVLRWSQRRKAEALALAASKGTSALAFSPANVRQLRSRLSRGEALVDYTLLDSLAVAVVVTARDAEVVSLPLGTDSLNHLAATLRAPFMQPAGGRIDLGRAPYDLTLAAHLYDVLLRPLEPSLKGIMRLALVPDGELGALPFSALVRTLPAGPGDYQGAEYALDRYEIRYFPSARLLAPSPQPTGPTLAVFRDVPGAAEEYRALTAILPPTALRVMTGGQATETAVRAAAPKYAILHLAVHALADERDPLESHLVLGADASQDGIWHLAEIAAERRHSQLVVLSACETLSGPVSPGEGVIGLARAFLVSGAHSVLATDWPVTASTANVMGVFYQEMRNGASPGQALRSAQLRERRAAATSHPFFWAGFELVGGL